MHQAGQLASAAELYETLLAQEPENAEALHLLGMLRHQQGAHAGALELIGRAIALQPNSVVFQSRLAEVYRALGQFDEALAGFRRAADLDPAYAPARINLGRMLLARGQAAEALPHLQAAVQLQPHVAELRRNLGNALHGLGWLAEAQAAYLDALRIDPNLAMAEANLALVAQEQGQLDEALAGLQRAVELQPTVAIFWEQLAELRELRGDLVEAARCWEHASAIVPHGSRGHVAVGRALQKRGRTDEAAEQFRAALRIEPNLSEAYEHLGKLHQQLGEVEQAEAALRAAIRLRPSAANAHVALAMLLRGKLPLADLELLRQRIADPRTDDEPRAHLMFALANVLDAGGQFAEAADALRRAHALALDRARRSGRAYVPADHERFVDAVLAAFGPKFFAQVAGGGNPTRRPVFVFGLPRSGTSLVEQILASHPSVYGAGELIVVPQTFAAVPTVLGRPEQPLDCMPQLDAAAIARLATRHLEALRAIDGGRAERIVDKAPSTYQFLGFLRALFPNAALIHCRRNLRDVAVSCWITDFEHVSWSHDPEHIATHFRQYRRVMDHWRGVLPGVIHDVEYEATVADVEAVARRLVAACDLAWDPVCLEFYRTRRPVRTSSAGQVRQPIYRQSVERWKHYERELADLFAQLPGD